MKQTYTLAALMIMGSALPMAAQVDTAPFLSADVEQVVVAGRQRGEFLSKKDNIATTVISRRGLQKLACCNLAESFENSAAVTVGYSDAISGARQIRLLGLSGAYTQMLEECRPAMRGISGAYALEYVPGAWMESIQIAKGITSVMQGADGLSGQINLELRKPDANDLLFVNAYLNNELRSELNVIGGIKASDRLHGNVMGHISRDFLMVDRNKDGFLDMPMGQRASGASRWLYLLGDGGAEVRSGIRLTYDERISGQTDYKPALHKGDTIMYGSEFSAYQGNAYLKVGIPFGDSSQHSAALIADYTLHNQDAYYGLRRYDARQQSAQANLTMNLHWGSAHTLAAGASGTADAYSETLGVMSAARPDFTDDASRANLLSRNEYAAGVYGEYTYNMEGRVNAIAGARADYNNLYGALFTPRAHVRWNIIPDLTLRASAGRGYRSVNAIANNLWMLATGSAIAAGERPKIESAWTYGANLTHYIRIHDEDGEDGGQGEEKGYISVDFFRTDFSNQFVADQEIGGKRILLYNLAYGSYANNYQADFSIEPLERLSIGASFRYSDTRLRTRQYGWQRKPLVERFKGLLNVSYATKFNRWTFDLTAQANGQARLPDLRGNSDGFTEEYSPVYPMFFFQVTRRLRGLDIYVGCENILDYMQSEVIISAEKPFGDAFNASVVWGPLRGRTFYAGIRWTIERAVRW